MCEGAAATPSPIEDTSKIRGYFHYSNIYFLTCIDTHTMGFLNRAVVLFNLEMIMYLFRANNKL